MGSIPVEATMQDNSKLFESCPFFVPLKPLSLCSVCSNSSSILGGSTFDSIKTEFFKEKYSPKSADGNK
ncbi:MAG: hypothetical protein ACOYMA_19655 [Bacteroidia bacterium]